MDHSLEFELPVERREDMRRAKWLEWLTIVYICSVIILMYFVVGSSQAMKTAWIEDCLALIPPIGFLIASRVCYLPGTDRFPYGFHRATVIAYFISSLVLAGTGVFLLIDGTSELLQAQHPTIGSVQILGETIWLGWLMIVVLVWSTIPSFFLGKAKLSLAKRLHDKPLFADAQMNKADWMTGASAGAGILGIGLGWWWADAAAAIIISFEILLDGFRNVRAVIGDLMDRAPKSVDHSHFLDIEDSILETLRNFEWINDVAVRLREQGHVFFGDIYLVAKDQEELITRREEVIRTIKQIDWRLHEITVQFLRTLEKIHPS